MDKESDFYKELIEVYDISNKITEKGDESEEVAIAQFWDCNPFVSVTRGHLMFAVKKISPGAHWIGICKIACKKAETEPFLIVFDARPNCIPFSYGKSPTQEGWLRALVDKGFPTENILLVGIRNPNLEEISFLKKNSIKFILTNSLLDDLQETCDMIMEISNKKELYVSIDVSIIDPAFAPSTNYKEPGGLTSRQFLYLIQRINKIKNLKAIDLVEINKEEDRKNDNMTVKLGAKILSEFL